MKKLVTVLLIVVIVFNFILCNLSYADLDTLPNDFDRFNVDDEIFSKKETLDNVEAGKDSSGTEFKPTSFSYSFFGVVLQYLTSVINSLPMSLQALMTFITINPENAGEDDAFLEQAIDSLSVLFVPGNIQKYSFTVKRVVFNQVALFNIDVFNMEDTYEVGISEPEIINQSQALIKLKENTAGWFYTCRLLAIMLNAIVLLYVGIRMTLSTVASEEAKYKKMMADWVMSMVIIFLLPYIMLLVTKIGNLFENIVFSVGQTRILNGAESFEDIIMQTIYFNIEKTAGLRYVLYCLFFWFLTYIQIKFFFAYFKRALTVFFLTIIAPFITVTYPIDKIGDGKAQAFRGWMQEYLINIIIQPIHALIYIIFIFTAGEIAKKAPFVAMLFLLTLGRIENIIRNIFGLTKSISMRNMEFRKRKR